jgi:PAS domain S-box-containing protein
VTTHILVIDDDVDTCETLSDVLSANGHAVRSATRGRAALAPLATGPVDIAIVDIQLPDMPGLELLDEIKRVSPHTEVIVVTACASIRPAIDAINGAAFAYITKPFEMDHLLATVRKALEKQELVRRLAASEELYRLVTEHILDTVFLLDMDTRFTFANGRIEALTGYRVDELVGQSISKVLTLDGMRAAASRLATLRSGRDVPFSYEAEVVRKDGTKIWVQVDSTSVVKDGRIIGRLGATRDITAHKDAERRWSAGNTVSGVLANAESMAVAARPLLRAIADVFSWRVGAVWLVDVEAALLRCLDVARADLDVAEFGRATRQSTFACGVGLPGRVWASGEPLWIADVTREPDVSRARVAAQAGLRSFFAFPIGLGRDVIGVVEFFSAEIRAPSSESVEWTRSIGRQIAQFWERTRAESRLREANAMLEALIQSSPVSVVALDLEGRITRWNKTAERLFGWTEAEVLGRPLPHVPDDEASETRHSLDVWRQGAVTTDVEVVRRRKDGSLVTMSRSGAPLRDAEGRVIGTVANLMDITDRKRSEEAARESEERFRATFDQAAVGIGHTTLDGRWLRVNQRLCDILGYTADELLARTFIEITHPDDLDFDVARLRQFMTNEIQTMSREKRFIRKDGTTVWVDLTVSMAHDPSGSPTYFIAVVQDISARKRLEQELLHAQRMEGVGQLAGGIAHDFNNLLTVIGGRCQIVLGQLGLADPLRRDLDLIAKTASRAAALTRQLLAFSRKQVLQPKVVDLNELVQNSTNLLKRLIGEDIELTFVPAPAATRVRVDPGQVEQVIVNLAVNARDAMAEGGRLTIETKAVALDAGYAMRHVDVTEGPYVMLAVTDTGSGMDAATQARIFEPFFTTKGPGKGTGLGLATVYGIIKQSGGHIRVYSEPGIGTAFKIYLPSTNVVAQPMSHEIADPLPRGTETVLVVEDEVEVRRLAKEFLEQLGYTVLEAVDAPDALLIAERHMGLIHLLLTDVVMPGMSGRALTTKFTEMRPETRILYMSGYTDDAIVRHGVLDAGVELLEKPFSIEVLAVKARAVLDRHG